MGSPRSRRRSCLLKIKNRAIRRCLRAAKREGRELHPPIATGERNGAVGGAEVDSDKTGLVFIGLVFLLRHLHHYFAAMPCAYPQLRQPVSDFAQSVKQQADIVKVIEGYIRLRKAGAQNYTGLCPFHKEKSPSFSVHAVRQFYHCFGCHESGDVFSFVAKIENVTFPEAVRIVAQKCGIPLPKREFSSPEEAAEARLRTRLLDLHEIAVGWFEQQLASPEGALAREYLASRGLDAKGIKEFRIGYAPDSFNALRDRLSSVADAETLRLSGLVSAKETGTGPDGQP